MQKLKCIIVDDEEADIKLIKDLTKDIQRIEIVAEYRNPIIALQNLDGINLVLLDVTFEGFEENGIDFIKEMSNSSKVIIISGSKSHAFDAFQLRREIVYGYLLKPIDRIKLIRIINEVYQATFDNHPVVHPIVPQHITPLQKEKNSFFIKVVGPNKPYDKVYKYDEILYFTADNDYREIHEANKSHLTSESLKNIFDKLPKDTFVQTNRSYIVNVSNIESIEGNIIYFRNSDKSKKFAKTTPENSEILKKKIGQ